MGWFGCRRLTAVSAQILQFFVCREVNGVSYLVVDFQLVCGSAEYNKYLLVAVFALLVYPIGTSASSFSLFSFSDLNQMVLGGCAGIPCLFGFLLYQNRRRLKVPVVMARYGLLYEGKSVRHCTAEHSTAPACVVGFRLQNVFCLFVVCSVCTNLLVV